MDARVLSEPEPSRRTVNMKDPAMIYGSWYMVKTTVYLDQDLVVSLRALSQRKRKPQAELIREAIRKYATSNPPPLPAGMGMFDSGRADISRNYRKLLKQAVRDRRWP
jgi:Ribbon-helix-helix protein, copG family